MQKHHKHQPFTHYGEYDQIGNLTNDVLLIPEIEWEKFTYRQKNIVGHKHTQTIPLLFDPVRLSRPKVHKHYGMFEHYLTEISSQLNMVVRRANLVKLLAQSEIPPHYDRGDFLKSTRRIHLPITTNNHCIFMVGGEEKHLQVGHLWEINNTGMEHSVHNRGDTHRIHLVIDVR